MQRSVGYRVDSNMTGPLNEGAENEESQQALNFGMAHAFVGAQHNSVTAAIDALEIDYRPNDFARNRTPRHAAENAEDVYRIWFSSPPARNHGYRMDEVDAFLDVVAARLKMRNT